MKETISADLGQVAVAKGMGKSEKATIDWHSGQHKEWLLLFDNTDNLTFIHTFPAAPHGNILITSQNHNTCTHTHQICQVSDMSPENARDLFLEIVHLENTPEIEALTKQIMKVDLLSLSSR